MPQISESFRNPQWIKNLQGTTRELQNLKFGTK